jgi:hypothetical protein
MVNIGRYEVRKIEEGNWAIFEDGNLVTDGFDTASEATSTARRYEDVAIDEGY